MHCDNLKFCVVLYKFLVLSSCFIMIRLENKPQLLLDNHNIQSGSADILVNATSEAHIVLPYYRKGTLHDYLTFGSTPLDTEEILRLFYHICDAVRYLHEFSPEPLAHRDLKTANVCLTDNMSPVLMDLGSVAVAKVQVCGSQDAQKLQDTATEKCSMPYRAPELFNVESYCVIDERTDIWVAMINL